MLTLRCSHYAGSDDESHNRGRRTAFEWALTDAGKSQVPRSGSRANHPQISLGVSSFCVHTQGVRHLQSDGELLAVEKAPCMCPATTPTRPS
jgi:hypothetical protein